MSNAADASPFKDWDREELVTFADFLLHNYRVMDAFWFLNLERELGLDSACHFNECVWGKVGALATRDIIRRFGITDRGLSGFRQVLARYPWNLIVGYQLEELDHELLLRVPLCPAQEGRLAHGADEYPCRAMHEAEFKGMISELDPAIRVECLFAPPDPHPAECFCAWRFTVSD